MSGLSEAEARLRVLGALLDLATAERDDSLTEIELLSRQYARSLWPRATDAEWLEAERFAPYFTKVYPPEEET